MKHPFQIPYIKLSTYSDAELWSSREDCKCIIFTTPESEQQELGDLLKKIIGATGLDSEKETIQLSVTPESAPRFSEIRNLLPDVPLLCFGIPPQTLGLYITPPFFQALEFSGFTWLFSPSIKELSTDKDKKLKLWNALKKLFELNP